jgi:hypothetical protein
VENLSPGPAAHQPQYSAASPDPIRAVFGSSSRASEEKRFMAACLVANLSDAPGPGAYRHRCGKGYAKTFGDGPCAAIGDAPRRLITDGVASDSPGAKYEVPSSFGRGSACSLGPRENIWGHPRDRNREARLARKQYIGPGLPAQLATDTPPPGKYVTEQAALDMLKTSPKVTFDKAPLSNANKVRAKPLRPCVKPAQC